MKLFSNFFKNSKIEKNKKTKLLSLKNLWFIGFLGINYVSINYFLNLDNSTLRLYKWISKVSGKLSQVDIPLFLREFFFKNYSILFNVNIDDIKKELKDFNNFNEFFTREIKERKIEHDQKAILCPSDSQILEISEITQDKVLLIKNKNYNLGELLYGDKNIILDSKKINEIKTKKENKLYSVIFYLNPGDYHRFHSPSDFDIKNSIHIHGNLYPVKLSYIKKKSNIYEKNERISIFGKSPLGLMTFVAVGALNVGSIDLSFDSEIKTNLIKGKINEVKWKNYDNYKIKLRMGDELGKFNLGSTVVLIFEVPENFKFLKKAYDKVKYGDILGEI